MFVQCLAKNSYDVSSFVFKGPVHPNSDIDFQRFLRQSRMYLQTTDTAEIDVFTKYHHVYIKCFLTDFHIIRRRGRWWCYYELQGSLCHHFITNKLYFWNK